MLTLQAWRAAGLMVGCVASAVVAGQEHLTHGWLWAADDAGEGATARAGACMGRAARGRSAQAMGSRAWWLVLHAGQLTGFMCYARRRR